MITKPMEVDGLFRVRKSHKQKTQFRQAIIEYAERYGYSLKVEKGKFGCQNLVIGDPDHADFLVTAHYDTPASIGLPNFITPCNPIIFILWQLCMLIPFFAVAFLAGVLVSLITNNEVLIFLAAYVSYFAMLLLMMFGPANRNNANDNTSGVVTVLEIMAVLPENLKRKVCFVLFDLEEAGLIGSASYRKTHKAATDHQIVFNLDCVGDGDHIVLFLNKQLRNDPKKLMQVEMMANLGEQKKILLHKKGFSYCPSDHKHFPYGVGIMAFRKKPVIGYYCNRIHTWRDTILEEDNVNILRNAIIETIAAAEK